jgi:hypothetical protein
LQCCSLDLEHKIDGTEREFILAAKAEQLPRQ